MADATKTVEIIFQGIDKMSSITSSVEKGITDFAGKLEDVTAPLAALTENILKA